MRIWRSSSRLAAIVALVSAGAFESAIAADEKIIPCPTKRSPAQDAGDFSGEWRAPAHAARLAVARVGQRQGAAALLCGYKAFGSTYYVFRRPPVGYEACKAAGAGFRCYANNTGMHRPRALSYGTREERQEEAVAARRNQGRGGSIGDLLSSSIMTGSVGDAASRVRLGSKTRVIMAKVYGDKPTVSAFPRPNVQAQPKLDAAPAMQGEFAIPPSWTADLDQGRIGAGAESDLWLSVSEGHVDRFLAPQNGARIAVMGIEKPNAAICDAKKLEDTPIDLSRISVGAYVCFVTNRGRAGYFQFKKVFTERVGAIIVDIHNF